MDCGELEDYSTQDLKEMKEELLEDINGKEGKKEGMEEALKKAKHDLRNVNFVLKVRDMKK